VQGADLRQQVSYFGVPAWRWNNKVSVALKTQDFALASRTIAPQHQDPVSSSPENVSSKVGVYTDYDFVYGIGLPWNGDLHLGVNNIFDTIGGKENGNVVGPESIVRTSLYSYVGRSYFARVTQRF
jgi:iron complex outermembrane recepter protein